MIYPGTIQTFVKVRVISGPEGRGVVFLMHKAMAEIRIANGTVEKVSEDTPLSAEEPPLACCGW